MSIKVRTKTEKGITTVSMMMRHPMETGRRKNLETGEAIPIHHITEISCELNDEIVMAAVTGAGISTNPYFSFRLSDANAGDTLTLTWQDNLGNTDTFKTKIK